MDRSPSSKRYLFGNFSFDTNTLELHQSGERVSLRVQPARLLLILLDNAPDTVSRQILRSQLWDKGMSVEFEQGLNACVNQLRMALGDSAGSPKFIATQPKRGYRFIAPTTSQVSTKYPSVKIRSWSWIILTVSLFISVWLILNNSIFKSPSSASRIYIAPVQINGSSLGIYDGVAQYALRLGIVERLVRSDVAVLQPINGYSLWQQDDKFAENDSSFYRLFLTLSLSEEETLKMSGQVMRGRYQVEAHLIGGLNDKSRRKLFYLHNLDASNLSSVSEKIALWLSSFFDAFNFGEFNLPQLSLTQIDGPEYFDAMIRARRAFDSNNLSSLVESLNWYNKALSAQAKSMEALGGKALVLAVLSGSPGYPAESTYQQSLSIASQIRENVGPTSHSELVRGYIYLYRDWDLLRARQAFDLAIELAPGNAMAHSWRASILAAQGKIQEAALAADRAVELDPRSMAKNSDRCWFLGVAGRYREAVNACDLALNIETGNYWARMGLVTAYEQLGQFDDALKALLPVFTSFQAEQRKQFLDSDIGNNGSTKNRQGTNEKTAESLQSKVFNIEAVLTDDSFENLKIMNCAIADTLVARIEGGRFPLVQAAAFNAQCGRFTMAEKLLIEARKGGESGVLFYSVEPRFYGFRHQYFAKNAEPLILPSIR